jgi:copper chaperone NosL
MSRYSTAMIWIAVILFFGVFVFPLWSISLNAPQYPEGMGMHIWMNKITGHGPHDLQNINGLNHYIGMKAIEPDSIPELRYMKYIVGILIVLGALTGILRRRWLLIGWVVVCMVVAAVGLIDFYRWGYDYGHNLDPDAPIKVPGMTYQPPLFGAKKLLNITATSYPAAGGLMSMAAVVMGGLAILVDGRRKRSSAPGRFEPILRTAYTAFLPAILTVIICSCSVKPSPIEYGSDTCTRCLMTIADEKYGAEVVTAKGKTYKYDSVECMVAHTRESNLTGTRVRFFLTVDYAEPRQLVDATAAVYLHSPTLRSPMAMNLTSFGTVQNAERARMRHPGDLLSWEGAQNLIERGSDIISPSNDRTPALTGAADAEEPQQR